MLAKLIVLTIFVAFALVLSRIPLTPVLGTALHFSSINLVAPSLGGVMGGLLGTVSIIAVQLLSGIFGWQTFSLDMLIWIFPLSMLGFVTLGASALYFGSRSRLLAAIPLAAIALFVAHPTGAQVWYVSLLWLVPVLVLFSQRIARYLALLVAAPIALSAAGVVALPVWLLPLLLVPLAVFFMPRFSALNTRIFPLALGATLVDHAIGSVAYLYAASAYPSLQGLLDASIWAVAFPIGIAERVTMAVGISLTYVAFFHLLAFVTAHLDASLMPFEFLKKARQGKQLAHLS
jgi:hypothetical protein